MTIGRFIFLLVFLGFSVFAAFQAQREFNSFLHSKTPLIDDLRQLETPVLPRSNLGVSRELLRCADGMGSISLLLLPQADQTQLIDQCFAMAQQVLNKNPSHSLAHLTLALASDKRSDFAGFEQALLRSYATAPYEGWLADRRMRLALKHHAKLSEAAQQVFALDVSTMLQETALRRVIVQVYVRNTAARPLLTSIAETQEPGVKRAFLSAIKSELGT